MLPVDWIRKPFEMHTTQYILSSVCRLGRRFVFHAGIEPDFMWWHVPHIPSTELGHL